jgi:uncharacterized membrane protein (DUF485 family)
MIFAPIAAVAEDARLRPALRAGFRAARAPGPRHLLIVFGYLVIAFFMVFLVPGGPATPATPPVVTWSYVFFVGFLHQAILAAFVYRWFAVREFALSEGAIPRPARRSLFR